MEPTAPLHATIPIDAQSMRLDQALAELFPDFSRNRLQRMIRDGSVLVDGRVMRPRDPVKGGERVRLEIPPLQEAPPQAEPMPLSIVAEDEDLLVINKPAGLVVHPGAGNWTGTLVNALLHHCPALAGLPRAGLVHRLDKDTTGLLVIAKTERSHRSLVAQLQERTVTREYIAVVNGRLISGGDIDACIGRHPQDRKRMAVIPGGKPALTRYRIEERFRAHTLLRLQLATGRTHQIRVHMAHIGYPVLGDPVYGGRFRIPPRCGETLLAGLRAFRRQALHARRLALLHPANDTSVEWQAPPPADLEGIVGMLREDCKVCPS